MNVSRHIAHYELLPSQLGVFPTEENLNFYKEDAALLANKAKVSQYAAFAKNFMKKMILEIPMNTSNTWTLTKDNVRIALRYNVNKNI